jgi:hypothetical protein
MTKRPRQDWTPGPNDAVANSPDQQFFLPVGSASRRADQLQGVNQVQSTGGLRTFFGESGYYTVTQTPRREYGINVRYAFGSH